MPPDSPVACSLSADAMPKRLAEIAALGKASLLTAEIVDAHAVLCFRADADTRERLAAVVAAEAECCAFLTMTLQDEPGAVALAVDGPREAAQVVQSLLPVFTGEREAA